MFNFSGNELYVYIYRIKLLMLSMGGFKDDQVETTILKWVCANKNIQLVQKSMNKISNQINIFK